MRLQRRIANLLLRTCGLVRLHGSGLQQGIRTFLDEIDFQHLRDTRPCPVFAARSELYRYVASEVLKDEPIDYLEFGVYRGESIREWLALNRNPQTRFFGFDSFEGLPQDWRAAQGKGHFDVAGELPRVDDERVVFVKGWFEETLPRFVREFAPRNRLVLHLDADLYASTLLPLFYFAPMMKKGTLLIFDEFYDREHEFKAFRDYLRVYPREFRVVGQTNNYAKVCLELD